MRKVERDITEKAGKSFGNLTYQNLKKLQISGIIYTESKRDVTLNFIKHFMGRDQREKEKRI